MDALWAGLIDDAVMLPPAEASAEQAAAEHLEHRQAWYAEAVGPLVVPDDQLAAVDRAFGDLGAGPVDVQAVNTTGAGGLVSLTGRTFENLTIVSVESPLRDLSDLAGNAARVVAAARELPSDVGVFVELPAHHGWERALETVEAEGLSGMIRTSDDPAGPNSITLHDQLRVLVEADLPFKVAGGLHHAWADSSTYGNVEINRHGFVTVMAALLAVVDGANPDEVDRLLDLTDTAALTALLDGWGEAEKRKIRRRFLGFDCDGVTDPIDDLVRLGQLHRG
ncbi:MAG: hypothetical protein L0G99_14390 [Propionibacteriales bacterium]|nr:hypothetical protein [Propionibacteriales bacterium]